MIVLKVDNQEKYFRGFYGSHKMLLTKHASKSRDFKTTWLAKEFLERFKERFDKSELSFSIINTNKLNKSNVAYYDFNTNLLKDKDVLLNRLNNKMYYIKMIDNVMCIQKENGRWYPIMNENITTRSGDYDLDNNAIKLLDYIKM